MKVRRKPLILEAVRWDGRSDTVFPLAPFQNAIKPPFNDMGRLHIHTLAGVMVAEIGDYIIKGVQGEIYPCKPDLFDQTYGQVQEVPVV